MEQHHITEMNKELMKSVFKAVLCEKFCRSLFTAPDGSRVISHKFLCKSLATLSSKYQLVQFDSVSALSLLTIN